MNIRFAAPSGAAEMFEPGSEGVLWWDDYTDDGARPLRRRACWRAAAPRETCPKIVETFGSAEFYSLRMSPNLVGTRADRDIPLPAERPPLLLAEHPPRRRSGRLRRTKAGLDALLHAGGESEPVDRNQPRADAARWWTGW